MASNDRLWVGRRQGYDGAMGIGGDGELRVQNGPKEGRASTKGR